MTALPKFPLVAVALIAATLAAGSTGVLKIQEAAAPSAPFWQMQGTGPSSHEVGALTELRAEARLAETSTVVASAR